MFTFKRIYAQNLKLFEKYVFLGWYSELLQPGTCHLQGAAIFYIERLGGNFQSVRDKIENAK